MSENIIIKTKHISPTRWLVITDVLAIILGLLTAWGLSFAVNHLVFDRTVISWVDAGGLARMLQTVTLAAGLVLYLEYTGHYRSRMSFWIEMRKIVCAIALVTIIDGFIQFSSREDFSRLWLISGWVLAGIAIVILRVLARAWMRQREKWQVPTLIVGTGATATAAINALRAEERDLGYIITAQIPDLSSELAKCGNSWQTLCTTYKAQHVIIALDGEALEVIGDCLQRLMREQVSFSISPPLRDLPVLGMEPHYFINHNVMLLTRHNGLEQPLSRLTKRCFDIIVSSTALLVLSPLFLVVAIMIRRDGGTAFFPHHRVGRHGRIFNFYKFRSMVMDSDAVLARYLTEAGPEIQEEWKIFKKLRGNDPRVTKTGRWLRSTSIDELPQLLNVLLGSMSLVGPRPLLLHEVEEYGDDIALYHSVYPGITGLWQVSGRNEVSFRERVAMESWYVRNWSLWHDVAILFKTVSVVLKGGGAY